MEATWEREMDKGEMGSPRIQPRPSVPIPRLIAWGGGGGAPAYKEVQAKEQEILIWSNAPERLWFDQVHLKGEHMHSNLPHSRWQRPVKRGWWWMDVECLAPIQGFKLQFFWHCILWALQAISVDPKPQKYEQHFFLLKWTTIIAIIITPLLSSPELQPSCPRLPLVTQLATPTELGICALAKHKGWKEPIPQVIVNFLIEALFSPVCCVKYT